MLISIQFPFADARKFLVGTGRLSRPEWPLPVPDTEFVRSFGSIRFRKLGGIEGWIGENEVCEADHALQFCGNLSFFDPHSSFQLFLRCAFRRLYFDGWAVGKFEVGISPKKHGVLELSKEKSKNLINHILQFPIQVKNSSDSTNSCELIKASKYLTHFYLHATTARDASINPQEWWIRPGMPLVFLHYTEQDNIRLPYRAKPVRLIKQSELQLLQCLVPYKGTSIRMWTLGPSSVGERSLRRLSTSDYDEESALRICLLRLHSEHECLRLILGDILTKKITMAPRTEESDNLQYYFNNAIARIGKLEAQSAKQSDVEIVDIARESVNLFSPGQRDALLNTLESLDMRRNVLRKVESYTNDLTKVLPVIEVQSMGDTYIVQGGKTGTIGPDSHAHDMTFT